MVLSQQLWQRRFGADPHVVGRTVIEWTSIHDCRRDARRFSFPSSRYQLWVPLPLRAPNPDSLRITRTSRFVQVLAKLKPDASPDAAASDLRAIASSLAQAYPDSHANASFVMSSLTDETVGNVRATRQLLFAVVLLLLIACGNVTSLLLARLSVRGPEVLVRAALGASGGRLVRQFFIETVVLYAAGTAAGIALARQAPAAAQCRVFLAADPSLAHPSFAFRMRPA